MQAAIADERAILAYCTTALSAAAGSGEESPLSVLRLIAAQQRRHVGALRAALTDAGADHVGRVPRRQHSPEAELASTRDLLVNAQRQRRSDAMTAESGLLARLFASVSASHAVAAGLDSLQG